VKARDFVRAVQRVFTLNPGASASGYYAGIVGGARCFEEPKTCDLTRGIVADEDARTVTFRLVAPDPEFLHKLALPFASAVPSGTPLREALRPLPATGPYVIRSYEPKHGLELVRNKYFHEWSQAAQPDGYPNEIVSKVGGTSDEAIDDVIAGRADVFNGVVQEPQSVRRLSAMQTRHASQIHSNPTPKVVGLFLNTRVPPFDRLAVRRALNYAADRAEAVRILGGENVAQTTCQILPPNFPGYRPYCPYTVGTRGAWSAPDLAKAHALIAASGTRGMHVTVWSWADVPAVGRFAAKLLRSLGYRVSIEVRKQLDYWPAVFDRRTRAQIGAVAWLSDYPTPAGFYNPVLSCPSFLGNANPAQFCDPSIDRQIAAAVTEQANPDAARGVWERVDRQTVDQAPWVPLVNPKSVDVLSRRVGNYQYSVHMGMLLDQLWVR
jgi:peptide/nickel transport system substrate-binding protein